MQISYESPSKWILLTENCAFSKCIKRTGHFLLGQKLTIWPNCIRHIIEQLMCINIWKKCWKNREWEICWGNGFNNNEAKEFQKQWRWRHLERKLIDIIIDSTWNYRTMYFVNAIFEKRNVLQKCGILREIGRNSVLPT